MIFLTDRAFYQGNFRGSQQEAANRIPPLLWLLPPIHHGNVPSPCADYKVIIAAVLYPVTLSFHAAELDMGGFFCKDPRQEEIRRKI